eukprot:scaffold74336_cov54-Attheya_sp.AAC.2
MSVTDDVIPSVGNLPRIGKCFVVRLSSRHLCMEGSRHPSAKACNATRQQNAISIPSLPSVCCCNKDNQQPSIHYSVKHRIKRNR